VSAHVPEEIQWLLELVVGERWPDGDEGRLRDLSRVWSQAAGDLESLRQQATADANAIHPAAKGAAADAFAAYWAKNIDDGRTSWPSGATPAALPWAVEFCKGMAQSCDAGALEIETAKLTIIGNLVILAATLAPQLLIPGEGEAAVAVEVPIAREAAQFVLKEAVQNILKKCLQEAVKMALMQGGLALGAQLFQMAEGHRRGVDWASVGTSAEGGAVGGALGAGFGGVTGAAGKALGGGFEKSLGTAVGRTAVAVAGGMATNVGSDLLMNGNVSLADLTGGMGAAAVGGAAEGLHDAMSGGHAVSDLPHLDHARPDITSLDITGPDTARPDNAPTAGSAGSSLQDTLAGLTTLHGADGTVQSDPGTAHLDYGSSGSGGGSAVGADINALHIDTSTRLSGFDNSSVDSHGGTTVHADAAVSSDFGGSGAGSGLDTGLSAGSDAIPAHSAAAFGFSGGPRTSPDAHTGLEPGLGSSSSIRADAGVLTRETPPVTTAFDPRTATEPGSTSRDAYTGPRSTGETVRADAGITAAETKSADPRTTDTSTTGTRTADASVPDRNSATLDDPAHSAPRDSSPGEVGQASDPRAGSERGGTNTAGLGTATGERTGTGDPLSGSARIEPETPASRTEPGRPGDAAGGGERVPTSDPSRSEPVPAQRIGASGGPDGGATSGSGTGRGHPTSADGSRPPAESAATAGTSPPIDRARTTDASRITDTSRSADTPPAADGPRATDRQPAQGDTPGRQPAQAGGADQNRPSANGDQSAPQNQNADAVVVTAAPLDPRLGAQPPAPVVADGRAVTSPQPDVNLVPRKTFAEARPIDRPGGLKAVESDYQRRVEDVVPRNPDGSPVVHPPVDHVWVDEINDGGPAADQGRGINCVDCVRSGLETYYGEPNASAARTTDLDPLGRPVRDGEVDGIANLEAWAGAKYAYDGEGAAGLAAIEGKVRDAGPGSAAAVIVSWPKAEPPVIDPLTGREVDPGSHQIAVINDGGTIKWIDFQTKQISETFPYAAADHAWSITLDAAKNPITDFSRSPGAEAAVAKLADVEHQIDRLGAQDSARADPLTQPTRGQVTVDHPVPDVHDVAGPGGVDHEKMVPADYEGRRVDFGETPGFALEVPEEAGIVAEDGGWSDGSGVTMTPTERQQVFGLLDKAARTEQRVTPLLLDLEAAAPDSRLVGLPYRLKLPGSLSRKLADQVRDPDAAAGSVEEAIGGIKDSVRYTLCVPDEHYTECVNAALQTLVDKGFRPLNPRKLKNTWGEAGYHGINSNWIDPETALVFEVQFHTPTSFWAKEDGTHTYYEEERKSTTPEPRKRELQAMQNAVFASVPIAPGATGIVLPRPKGSP
jgi:hypothetical protein